jgi:hypothetical protein
MAALAFQSNSSKIFGVIFVHRAKNALCYNKSMEQQNPQGQWQTNPPTAGTGANPSVSPPPPPPIGVRTMESDIASIKESGGLPPEPKVFTPSELKPPPPPPPSQQPVEAKLDVPGYQGPEEAIFKPSGTISEAGVEAQKEVSSPSSARSWLKPVLFAAGGLIILAGLGFAGYYLVYPLLFGESTTTPLVAVEPQTSNQSSQPPATTTTPETSGSEQTQVFIPQPHYSFFTVPAEKSEVMKLTASDTALSIRAALMEMAKDVMATGTIKEIAVEKEDGSPEAFSRVISLLVPELNETALQNVFQSDFTLAIYFDANGAWPIYIARLKEGANLLDAQASYAGLEQSQNLFNLYLTDPGERGTWKDGNAGGRPTRYLTFAQKGASLNYGWVNDFLVISTSYEGMKTAVMRLGLNI